MLLTLACGEEMVSFTPEEEP